MGRYSLLWHEYEQPGTWKETIFPIFCDKPKNEVINAVMRSHFISPLSAIINRSGYPCLNCEKLFRRCVCTAHYTLVTSRHNKRNKMKLLIVDCSFCVFRLWYKRDISPSFEVGMKWTGDEGFNSSQRVCGNNVIYNAPLVSQNYEHELLSDVMYRTSGIGSLQVNYNFHFILLPKKGTACE